MKPLSVHQIEDNLTYASLRAAFLLTFDELMQYALAPARAESRPVELMDFFPPLKGIAPQIQLECILRTWQSTRIHSASNFSAIDTRILLASTELLASMAAESENPMLRVVFHGPQNIQSINDHWLVARIRCMQISWKSDHRRMLYQELGTSATPQTGSNRHTDCVVDESVWEILGKWRVCKNLYQYGSGLLTNAEMELVRDFFEEHSMLAE